MVGSAPSCGWTLAAESLVIVREDSGVPGTLKSLVFFDCASPPLGTTGFLGSQNFNQLVDEIAQPIATLHEGWAVLFALRAPRARPRRHLRLIESKAIAPPASTFCSAARV